MENNDKTESGRILNLDQLDFYDHQGGEHFTAKLGPVAARIGAQKLGYRVVKLPPGKKAWPFHAHYVNEEMFFVLSGEGSIRLGDSVNTIRQGDFIAAPPDPETAHQIINTSEDELVYLCVSTMLEPEVAVYPDSNKIGVLAGSAPGKMDPSKGVVKFVSADAGVDYWDGEN